MKVHGGNISNETIVSKVLRSPNKNFDYVVVTAIEESKDLSKYSFDGLISSLQAYKATLSRSSEKVDEKAFQVRGKTHKKL